MPVSSNIALHVKDQLTGVDETSIVMTVNGSEVIPTIRGTPMDYAVSYDPAVDFPYGETVTVTVDAADLSSPANVMEQVTYSFTTIREPSPARSWYVDGSVMSSGGGTSWETAFKKIQEGIDAAEEGDAVIVAPMAKGRYTENIHFRGKNTVLRSTDTLDPNVVAGTIINSSGAGPAVTFDGTEDQTCVLSGFTVRGGRAPFGGGILGGTAVDHCLAAIQNNVITANASDYGGGGLCYCDGEIRNNVIAGNSSNRIGGGASQCDGTIRENTIADNQATGQIASGVAWPCAMA